MGLVSTYMELSMDALLNGIITDFSGSKKGLVIGGREVIPPIYKDIFLFSDENYKTKYWQPSCYILSNGNSYELYIIHPSPKVNYEYKVDAQYDSIKFICQIHESAYFVAQKGDRYTILSNYEGFFKEGHLNGALYDRVEYTFKLGFKVYRGDKVGYVDNFGRIRLQAIYSTIDAVFYDSYIADRVWQSNKGTVFFVLQDYYDYIDCQNNFLIFKSRSEELYRFFKPTGRDVYPIGETEAYIVLDDCYRFNKKDKVIEERDYYVQKSYQQEADELANDIRIGMMDYYNCDPEAQWNTD